MTKRILLILILLAGTSFACRPQPSPTPQPSTALQGAKILMIVAHQNFRDEEYQRPRQLLEAQGATVVVASSSMEPARGMLGLEIRPNLLLKDVAVQDYAAIVYVGGTGASQYWDDPMAHAIARQAIEQGKVLAAICLAPATLARAGVLQGKRATVFASARGELEAGGAVYTGQLVERDGLIITANGPDAAEAFAEEIIRILSEK